jgi:DNA polymerase III subunit epsilon
MYLFFDTETSDLPQDFSAPETDITNWPRVIEIAWVVAKSPTQISAPVSCLIRPDGFCIAEGATRCHGITTDFALQNGVALEPVLKTFFRDVERATSIVAHNMEFDANVIGAECARLGIPNLIRSKSLRCTMLESTEHCRLPSERGFKWPRLTELHTKLFDSTFDNPHDAAADCLACMNCFFRLQQLGVM